MEDTLVIMSDTVESSQARASPDRPATPDRPQRRPWLLLVHHIPPEPAYFRVKVRRRLQQVGAVALKPSVYVLPRTDDAEEDLQWIRRMVEQEGGEATVCEAGLLGGMSDAEVESLFRAQSDAEYDAIVEGARGCTADPSESDVRKLSRGIERAVARDFFAAPARAKAERAVLRLRETLEARSGTDTPRVQRDAGAAPRGATWVTRAGVQVDRIASAWLIRRFIDAGARFRFTASADHRPEPGEIRFDMYDGEYTHEGEDCTFEVLARRFAPDDAAVRAIGEVVHDIDCKDAKFGREEAAGLASMIRGIVASHEEDGARLAAGATLFDGLYAAFERPGE